jgi:hypothetical protein
MTKYKFSLAFKLNDPGSDPESFLDALFESGCDDSTPGIGKLGYIAFDFSREADTAFDAVTSAIANVKQAIPDAKLIEASPDMGGISDIAELLNCTRQNIRQLIISDLETPPPLHEGKSPIWHMSDVLIHFRDKQRREVEHPIIELTTVNQTINAIRASHSEQQSLKDFYPDPTQYLDRVKALV